MEQHQRRKRSAPWRSISCVTVTYSLSLLLTFVPSGFTANPCVSTCLKGGWPVAPRLASSESWNHRRCWSDPSRYRSHGNESSLLPCSTACHELPLSRPTSNVSCSLR